MPKVASLTFQLTVATGKIGFLRFGDGVPITRPPTRGGRDASRGDRTGTA